MNSLLFIDYLVLRLESIEPSKHIWQTQDQPDKKAKCYNGSTEFLCIIHFDHRVWKLKILLRGPREGVAATTPFLLYRFLIEHIKKNPPSFLREDSLVKIILDLLLYSQFPKLNQKAFHDPLVTHELQVYL